MPITLRNTKGSPLTFNEVDNNFLDLQVNVNTETITSDREFFSTDATIQRLTVTGGDHTVYLPEDSAEDFTNLRFILKNIGSNNSIEVRTKDISTWDQIGNTFTQAGQFTGKNFAFAVLDENTIAEIQEGFAVNWSGEWLTTYKWNGSSWGMVGRQFDLPFPASSSQGAISFDSDRIILYGYSENIYTYFWNGTDWSSGISAYDLGTGAETPPVKLTDNYIAFYDNSNDQFEVWNYSANTWSSVYTWDSDFGSTSDVRSLDNLIDSDVSRFVFLWHDSTGGNILLSTYEYEVGGHISRIGNLSAISDDVSNSTTNYNWVASLTSTRVVVLDETNFELYTYDFNGSDWTLTGNGYTVTGFTSIDQLAALNTSTIVIQGGTSAGRTIRKVYESQPSYSLGTIAPGETLGYIHNGVEWLEVSSITPQTFDQVNVETLSSDKVLTANDKTIQKLNPNGNDRNIDLPDVSDSDLRISIYNGGSLGNLKVFSGLVDETWSSEIGNSYTIPTNPDAEHVVPLTSNRIAVYYRASEHLYAYEWNGLEWNQVGNAYEFPISFYIPSFIIGMVQLADNRVAVVWNDPVNNLASIVTMDFDGTNWSAGTKRTLSGGPFGWYGYIDGVTAMGSNRIAVYNTGSGSNQEDLIGIFDYDGSNWSNVVNYDTSQRNFSRLIGLDSDRLAGSNRQGERTFMMEFDGTTLYNIGGEIEKSPTLTAGKKSISRNKLFFDNDDNTYSIYEFDGRNFNEVEGTSISDSDGVPVIFDNKTIGFFDHQTNIITGTFKLQQDSDGLETIFPGGSAEFTNTGTAWEKTLSVKPDKMIAVSTSNLPLTTVAGAKYAVDTTGGAGTMYLPARPNVSDEIAILDAQSTFDSAALTIGRNGESIEGADSDATLNTLSSGKGFERKFAFVGGTRGWALIT